GLVERLEVEFDEIGAKHLPALQCLAIGRLGLAITEEDQLTRLGNAELQPGGKRCEGGQRPVARERISVVGTCHHGKRGQRVVDGEREHRDAVERAAGRHQPGIRDQPEARLEPDDVVEHGRHPAAARGVGAERQRHQARGYRDRGARARSTRHEIVANWIFGNAVGRAHADQAGGELVEVGLADDDGACRAQS
ncbi:hypothetical protein chiPu_0032502, partial [Chiloscyllium punctatum]|nr:hypothetical protein [Chiloscyllium punctatum]